MPKDDDLNGSDPAAGGVSANGAGPDLIASEAFIAAQQARFAQTRAELAAEGFQADPNHLAELRAAAAAWPE